MRTRTNRQSARRAAAIVAAATVAAMATWMIARAADVDFEVETWGGDTLTVGLPLVTATALAASLAGWGVLTWLTRRSDQPRRAWTRTATTVLIASLPGPLLSDASGGARVSLALMHVAVGAVLIPGLRSVASTGEPITADAPVEEPTLVSSSR